MKKILLFCTILAFFNSVTSCEKADKILLISNHKWVVKNNSPGGSPGDEYSFLDNRLFFLTTSSGATIDGRWDIYIEEAWGNTTIMNIETSGTIDYKILKLTSDELELQPQNSVQLKQIILAPKQD